MGLRPEDRIRLLLPVTLVLASALFALSGDYGNAAFRLDRAGIAGGEFYRLLTGHFVHLGPLHLILNIAGLVLVWFLVGYSMSLSAWVGATLLSIATISAGLLLGMPDLHWYVGLSGLLHGLLAAGLVASFADARWELRILTGILVLKLAWENLVGAVPGTGDLAGGEVVTEAHLLGAIAGSVAGLIYNIRVRRKAPI